MNMSESDVQKQIEHMIAFIQQEAKEKVQEIEAKAEEEFNIEKGRLVQQERLRLINLYEKKVKQITMLQKIHESRCLNQCRLSKLKCQHDIITNVLEESRQKLLDFVQNKEKYNDIMYKLILQALFQIMENEVNLYCLKNDLSLVKSLIPNATAEFQKSGFGQVQINVIESEYLSDESYGGIELFSKDGSIRVNNTLSSRLDLISKQKIPQIRNILFGENPNRKFQC